MNLNAVHLRGKSRGSFVSLTSSRLSGLNSTPLQLTDHSKVTSLVICFLEIQNPRGKNHTRQSVF